ncbi:hypothetical protein M0R72_10430 [Candidatus Pacearchaeota archaeon]|jgi:hypothetical protein|nr:hypothetical protein [Candidatus Pacearchaeota archaeon]
MERVLANLSSKVRSIKREGREFLVAPVTFLRPQVLNGSKGPLLYTPEAIRQSEPDWDGVPMVVNHPMKDGHHISAADSGVLRNVGIGLVKHPYTDKDGVLRGYGWFDVEKTTKVDPRIVHRLRSGQPIELSTGLFTSNKKAPLGSAYKGTPYSHVAEGYQPDHLAILPDQVGACSLRDGCGVLANRSSRPTKEQLTTLLLNSDSATHSIHRQLQSLLINAIGQPHSKNTGHFKPLNAGTGRGEAHDHAQLGTVTLTDQDKELGADAAKQKAELNQNPPNWAVDETKWERAKAAADKGKYTGDMYWAVVARIYQNMGGIIASKSTNNQEAIVAKLNQKLHKQVSNANPQGINQYTGSGGRSGQSKKGASRDYDGSNESKLKLFKEAKKGMKIEAEFDIGGGMEKHSGNITKVGSGESKGIWFRKEGASTAVSLFPSSKIKSVTLTKSQDLTSNVCKKKNPPMAATEAVNEDQAVEEEVTEQPKIVKVLNSHFIYRSGDQLFKQGYTKDKSGTASLTGEPILVNKVVDYVDEAVGNANPEGCNQFKPCAAGGGDVIGGKGASIRSAVEAAIGSKFNKDTAKTIGNRTSVLKSIPTHKPREVISKIGDVLKSQGFTEYAGRTKSETAWSNKGAEHVVRAQNRKRDVLVEVITTNLESRVDILNLVGNYDDRVVNDDNPHEYESVGNDGGGRPDQEELDEGVVVADNDEEEALDESDEADDIGDDADEDGSGEDADYDEDEGGDSGDEDSDVADESSVTNSQQGEPSMALNANDKKRIVDDLIGNCGDCGWTEKDRETLNAMKDETLMTMEECRKKTMAANQRLKAAEEEAVAAKAQVQQLATNQVHKLTDQEWMEQAPLPVRRVVANAQAIEAQEKNAIINRLVANINDENVRKAQMDRLQTRDLSDLQADLALMPVSQVALNPMPTANYLGMAPAFNQSRTDAVDPNDILELPSMEWGK